MARPADDLPAELPREASNVGELPARVLRPWGDLLGGVLWREGGPRRSNAPHSSSNASHSDANGARRRGGGRFQRGRSPFGVGGTPFPREGAPFVCEGVPVKPEGSPSARRAPVPTRIFSVPARTDDIRTRTVSKQGPGGRVSDRTPLTAVSGDRVRPRRLGQDPQPELLTVRGWHQRRQGPPKISN